MNYQLTMDTIINKTMANLTKITSPHIKGLSYDGTYSEENLDFYHIEQWTFSFYTGILYHTYNYTRDSRILKSFYSFLDFYENKITTHHMDTMHDLGFLYSLYAVALYKITGDQHVRNIALKAADELVKRFNIHGKFINAWGRMDIEGGEKVGLMIVDCMMNLPLLYWAWEETGHLIYRDIATAHADTTLQYMLREEGSICHAYKFDRETGSPIGERNDCGYKIGSAWARGTAWGIYGFVVSARYTKEERFFEASKKLSQYFLSNLKNDKIPVWDFKLPPHATRLIDTSAAAISICGMLELVSLNKLSQHETDNYLNTCQEIIETLSQSSYFIHDINKEAILTHSQCGPRQASSLWGDYFFVEAMMRIAFNGCTPW